MIYSFLFYSFFAFCFFWTFRPLINLLFICFSPVAPPLSRLLARSALADSDNIYHFFYFTFCLPSFARAVRTLLYGRPNRFSEIFCIYYCKFISLSCVCIGIVILILFIYFSIFPIIFHVWLFAFVLESFMLDLLLLVLALFISYLLSFLPALYRVHWRDKPLADFVYSRSFTSSVFRQIQSLADYLFF